MKENTFGSVVFLCPNLQDKGEYFISVDEHATHRQYLCVDPLDDNNELVLTLNNCKEFREVHIKPIVNGTYAWDGMKRGTHELVANVGDREANRLQAQLQARRAQAEAPVDVPVAVPANQDRDVSSKSWKKWFVCFSPAANQAN